MMVLRSLLFVPGNNMRMINKAKTLAADGIVFDLEDSVPLPDKEAARIMVRDNVSAVKSGGAYTLVRINDLSTGLTAEDVKVVAVRDMDGITLPKAEAKSDILALGDMLTEAEKTHGLEPGSFKVFPLIETAKGVVNAYEIASASERVIGLGFGAGDYCRDLGMRVSSVSPEQTELLFARSQTVICSRAAGVQALDTVFFGVLSDLDSFEKEAMLALKLGFKGKSLIHPSQIEIANRIFSPSPEEVDYAGKVVEAFEQAQAKGMGAVSLEGKMIDYMTYRQAKDLMATVAAMAEREKREN